MYIYTFLQPYKRSFNSCTLVSMDADACAPLFFQLSQECSCASEAVRRSFGSFRRSEWTNCFAYLISGASLRRVQPAQMPSDHDLRVRTMIWHFAPSNPARFTSKFIFVPAIYVQEFAHVLEPLSTVIFKSVPSPRVPPTEDPSSCTCQTSLQ